MPAYKTVIFLEVFFIVGSWFNFQKFFNTASKIFNVHFIHVPFIAASNLKIQLSVGQLNKPTIWIQISLKGSQSSGRQFKYVNDPLSIWAIKTKVVRFPGVGKRTVRVNICLYYILFYVSVHSSFIYPKGLFVPYAESQFPTPFIRNSTFGNVDFNSRRFSWRHSDQLPCK